MVRKSYDIVAFAAWFPACEYVPIGLVIPDQLPPGQPSLLISQ
jgi:hypothetical protein